MRLFKSRGLQIQCIDQSQSSFLDSFFAAYGNKAIFSKFTCTDDVHSMWLDPGLFAKALKAAGNCTMLNSKLKLRTDVHMSLAESGDRLNFEFDSVSASGVRKRSKHSIALFDPSLHGDEAEIDGAQFNWSAEVFTDTPMLLHEVVTQLKGAGCEELQLQATHDAITFASTGGSSSMMDACVTVSSDDKFVIACETAYGASFAFRYFLRLAKLCKTADRLLLQMGADSPLSAVVDLCGGGSCQVFLAPLVDEEDNGQEAEHAEAAGTAAANGSGSQQEGHGS